MLITSGIVSPWLGRWMDRNGAAPVLVAGSILTAAALGLLAVATGLWGYVAAWMAIGLATACSLALPSFTALAQVAGDRARQAMIVLMLLTGGSSSIAWPATAWLESAIGWRQTCLVFAAIHLLVCLPLHLFVLPRRRAHAEGGPPRPVSPPNIAPERRRLALLMMLPAFACSGFVSWGLSLHLVDMLASIGMTPAFALALGSSVGVLQVSARIGEFAFGRYVTPGVSAAAASVLMVAAFLLIAWPPVTTAQAVAFVVIYAFGSGLLGVTRATLPLWAFGSANYGTIAGRIAPVQNTAFAAAPLVFAAVTEAFGIRAGLLMSLAIATLAAVFMTVLAVVVVRSPAPRA
jgi:predicted MFS family arabinose efflux permease